MTEPPRSRRIEERVLAIDPSTRAIGWSVFEDGRYCESGVFQTIEAYSEYVCFATKFQHIVIEGTYYRINIATLKVLVETSVTCKVLARMRNPEARTWEIPASAWQSKQLGVGREAKRAQRKQLSILVARDIAGRDVTEDEADAINLGDYFVRYGGMDGRFEKGAGAPDSRKTKGVQDRR